MKIIAHENNWRTVFLSKFSPLFFNLAGKTGAVKVVSHNANFLQLSTQFYS